MQVRTGDIKLWFVGAFGFGILVALGTLIIQGSSVKHLPGGSAGAGAIFLFIATGGSWKYWLTGCFLGLVGWAVVATFYSFS